GLFQFRGVEPVVVLWKGADCAPGSIIMSCDGPGGGDDPRDCGASDDDDGVDGDGGTDDDDGIDEDGGAGDCSSPSPVLTAIFFLTRGTFRSTLTGSFEVAKPSLPASSIAVTLM